MHVVMTLNILLFKGTMVLLDIVLEKCAPILDVF